MNWRILTSEVTRFLDTLPPAKMRDILLVLSGHEDSFILATQNAGVLQCVLPACRPVPVPQCPYLHYEGK
jgi:hypothetical protein